MDQIDAPRQAKKPKNPSQIARDKRLVAALRENLKRRKAQGKARAQDAGHDTGPLPEPQNLPGTRE